MLRRQIVDRLIDALADTPAVLVNGARQTGKSTLVQAPEMSQGRQYLTRKGRFAKSPGPAGAKALLLTEELSQR